MNYVNPLYQKSTIYKNPLFEPLVMPPGTTVEKKIIHYEEIFVNNRLHCSNIGICAYKLVDKIRLGNTMKRSIIKKRTKFKGGIYYNIKVVTGKQLSDWIMRYYNYMFTMKDTQLLLNDMLKNLIFVNIPYNPMMEFNPSENEYYRFFEDDKFNRNIINRIVTVTEISYSIIKGRPRSKDWTFHRLNNILKNFYSKYVDYDRQTINYGDMIRSSEFQKIIVESSFLRYVNFSLLTEQERKIFFINVYNIMYIHACAIIGIPKGEKKRRRLLKMEFYKIGRWRFSLTNLNLLLRGKSVLGGHNLSLNHLQITKPDPRIHFALSNGAISSPLPKVYSLVDFEEQIQEATMRYVRNHSNFEGKTLNLPPIYKLYRVDFGYTERKILNHVQHYLLLGDKSLLKIYTLRQHRIYLIFNEFQWKSKQDLSTNIKEIDQQDVEFSHEKILQTNSWRKFFKEFCKREWASENILFWERVQEYKNCHLKLINDPNLLLLEQYRMAMNISNDFFVANSKYELNISRKDIIQINELIRKQKIDSDLFDIILKEIEFVMRDTYRRFILSTQFMNLKTYVKEQREKEKWAPPKGTRVSRRRSEKNILGKSFLLDRKSLRKSFLRKNSSIKNSFRRKKTIFFRKIKANSSDELYSSSGNLGIHRNSFDENMKLIPFKKISDTLFGISMSDPRRNTMK